MINNESFENIPKILQPTELKLPLYDHQLASIYKMEEAERKQQINECNDIVIDTNVGINADKTGYGKCHGYNTPIIMYNGDIKMVQDIKVGDLLMGDDSTPRKVLSLARGREQLYKIKQEYGDDYIVNESHILSLIIPCPTRIIKLEDNIEVKWINNSKNTFGSTFESKIFSYETYNFDKEKTLEEVSKFLKSKNQKVDICVKDYLKIKNNNRRRRLKGYKSIVDCWENTLKKDDPDPYLIGLFVDNGIDSLDNTAVVDLLYNNKVFEKLTHHKIIDSHTKIVNNNHIPYEYKINTIENRLKLIAGIIDSNGYFKDGRYKIIETNVTLSDDIKFVCNSLGFYCEVKKRSKYFKIIISGDGLSKIPVKIVKKNTKSYSNKNQLYTDIKIEKLDIGDYYGFVIDSTRRYLLKDFTVTHNTIAMATLVYRDKMEWDLSTPYVHTNVSTFAGGRIKKTLSRYYDKLDVTLVLASQSIIHQWYDECKRTPLSVKMITTKKLVDTTYVENYDIILVTPSMYNKIICKYSDMAWKRFIFDEPGHMKVSAMKKVIAGFVWLVTATPDSIIAKHKNCKNSFMYELISHVGWGPIYSYGGFIIVKNSDVFINHSFSMPQTHHLYYKCYNPIFNTVRGLVTNNITNMISAGNIQGAIKALGGGETKNIVELVKKKKLEEIDELKSHIKILKIRNKKKSITELEEKIKRINTQISVLDKRFTEMLKRDCTICFSQMSNPVMEPNCQNIFCGNCLLKWLTSKTSCPMCRDNIQSNQLIYINNKDDDQDSTLIHNKPEIKTKIDTVISLIKEKPNARFIIFSAWNKTFTPIRNQLNSNGISFIEVIGSAEKRKQNIDEFKSGNTRVIFLNSRNNGSGINLQESTDIIVYHDMSVDSLNQIIGRANRLGRTEPLYVHHLQI